MKGCKNINESVSSFLKSKIVAKRLTYKDIVVSLNERGVKCTESSFTTKLNRGTFSAAFFVECLNLLECESADINEIIKNSK
mgnify:CR=1 FL=1